MSTLKVTNIQSNGTGFNDVVNFQNASGTNNGTLCRAWVNFDGTGTVAIRASFNVSSITDNGTGDYTMNFTTALVDANYSACGSAGVNSSNTYFCTLTYAASSLRTVHRNVNNTLTDIEAVSAAVFR